MRKVTIIKPKKFVGSIYTYSVLIDGVEYAIVRNGEMKILEIPDGMRRLQVIAAGQFLKSDVMLINESDNDVGFRIVLKTGFLSPQIYLEKI